MYEDNTNSFKMESNNMKIAVLMSTYNGEKYLSEQINSILVQNLPDGCQMELFIRDDCSNDGSITILEDFSHRMGIHFTTGENLGAAKSFMKLLQDNEGFDYYAFADQDDYWYPDKLKNGINALSAINGPALYCSNCDLVDNALKPIGRLTHRKNPSYTLTSVLCLASCAQGCTSVFNKELASIIQNNTLPKVFIMHDSLITCVCALLNGKIIFDSKPSMKYRMHGKNVSGMVCVKQNLGELVVDRIKEITTKRKISMYKQTASILEVYGELIGEDNKKIGRIVIASEKSMIAKFRLVLSKELKHDTLNKTITKKLTILFGND